MIKITFHHPQKIIQHGLEQECMFVECFSASVIFGKRVEIDFGDSRFCIELELIDVIN
jgi:hypothetical protein